MNATPSSSTPTLDQLEKWARDSSGENWQKLLSALTDIFVADLERHATEYGEAYAEIVCKMLDEVATEVRAELSNRVAPLEKFPGKVVRRLATDEDSDVAGPVIEQSPALTDSDLLSIISQMLPERTMAVTRRKELGQKITEVLVHQGNKEVIQSVAGNPGAKFSDRTYRSVTEKAKSDPVLQERLVDRGDMSQALVVQITPFLSDELKARLRALDEPEGGSLLDALTEFTAESDQKKQNRKQRIEAYACIEQVRAGSTAIDDAIKRLATDKFRQALGMFLSGIGAVDDNVVSEMLDNSDVSDLASFLKGLQVKPAGFEAIARLRTKLVHGNQDKLSKEMEMFKSVSDVDAVAHLKSLRANSPASQNKS